MKKLIAALGLILLSSLNLSYAEGFGINVTRIVFQEYFDSTTVTLRNTSTSQAYVVQARMSQTIDGFEDTPFIVTPPIFRLDPDTTNNLRIKLDKKSVLPVDRESIFYLNTRAIPSSMQNSYKGDSKRISGVAQFGVGTIIKLFYRPKGLASSPEDAQRKIKFSKTANEMHVRNNSPYFINFASLKIDGKSLIKKNTPAMLEPYSEYFYPTEIKHGKITWSTINDFGGINEYTSRF
ncbi:fimbrial biogenesis chaperone [Obesumbacterium proteus]|uniref:fimbrial biogenesis chaperone n=1 Tax=Obesumbacterium proteus TaxID=82983 RepID=UPI002431B502|nr:molecular chaperone [Obesumbacterium proteus]